MFLAGRLPGIMMGMALILVSAYYAMRPGLLRDNRLGLMCDKATFTTVYGINYGFVDSNIFTKNFIISVRSIPHVGQPVFFFNLAFRSVLFIEEMLSWS
ncbi:MAG: hypothetical protein AAGC88_06695 [Bacteroidota bacterium]